MIKKALAILLVASVSYGEMTQVPFQEKDPKTNENFRNIYYQVDSIDSRVSRIESSYAGTKNKIINPFFSIKQRDSTTISDDTYHFDRWYALNETGSVTVLQQTLQENGQPTNLRMTQPDASAKRLGVAQIIEAIESQPLRGQAVTLSARIRCSVSQSIRYAILEHTGTADSVTSDVINTWTSTTYTPSNFFIAGIGSVAAIGATTPTAATWGDANLTAVLSSSVNNIVIIFWSESAMAQNATLDIGKVQFEPGAFQTSFEIRSLGQENILAFRFFWKCGGVASGFPLINHFVSGPGQNPTISVSFPVRMRISPSVLKSGTWSVSNCGQPSISFFSQDGFALRATSTAGPSEAAAFPDSSDDILTFDSEL